MFYYKNWERFCEGLKTLGVKTCRADESLKVPAGTQFVVLKHDVEGAVSRAHRLAQIEKENGILGTYYVQGYLLKNAENVKLLQEMQSWGHEISYHYDVLDACSGDYDAALKQFEEYLKIFKEAGFEFTTICQHGNPVKKRVGYTSNRDFFRNEKIKSLYSNMVDMVVDYSKYATQEYKYVSDAGFCWNIITEPETNDLHPEVKNVKLGGFKNLKKEVEKGVSMVISTHPQRWRESAIAIYTHIWVFKVVRAVVKAVRHVPGAEWLMNKFYFLAKKI